MVPLRSVSLKAGTIFYRQAETIFLKCLITAYPMPVVLWLKNNTIIQPSHNIAISEGAVSLKYYQASSTLNIYRSSFIDGGNYQCQGIDNQFNKTIRSQVVSLSKTFFFNLL